jgi:3-deoxy-D-manno-octulosonic-acid transferase
MKLYVLLLSLGLAACAERIETKQQDNTSTEQLEAELVNVTNEIKYLTEQQTLDTEQINILKEELKRRRVVLCWRKFPIDREHKLCYSDKHEY